MNTNSPYKILALDGGGVWALIQVMALKEIFGNIKGHEVLHHFDLVAATSGGSIVAACLAENLMLDEIEELFKTDEKRKMIFKPLKFWEKSLANKIGTLLNFGLGPKYKTEQKIVGIETQIPTLSQMPLHEVPGFVGGTSNTHFLIIGFDYTRQRAKFFRSNVNSRAQTINLQFGAGSKVDLPSTTFAQAIHASTNAPINFFQNPAIIPAKSSKDDDKQYWDGAIAGYNNPILAAVVEAISNDVAIKDIRVLSIGTTTKYLPKESSIRARYDELVLKPKKDTGLVNDMLKMTTSILSDPPDAATYIAYSLMSPKLPQSDDVLVRMCPVLQPRLNVDGVELVWDLPQGFSFREFDQLMKMELDAMQPSEIELIEKVGEAWKDGDILNQPIRNGKLLQCILGYNTFSDAKQAVSKWLDVDRGTQA